MQLFSGTKILDSVQEFLQGKPVGSFQGNFQNNGNANLQNNNSVAQGFIQNYGKSATDGSGYTCACRKCNGKIDVSYGVMGGFCRACNEWSFDREFHSSMLAQYGLVASTCTLLAKYDKVHVKIKGVNRYPSLLVMPNMIILQEGASWKMDIPFNELKASTASKGKVQQLTLIIELDGTPVSLSIDMEGGSYDDASGEDLARINKLIKEG